MKTIASALLRMFCLFVFVLPVMATAQQKTFEQIKAEMISSWVVAVEGESRTRTIKISAASLQPDSSVRLDAVYGWIDGNQTAISASLVQSGQDVKLLLTTQAGSNVKATHTSDGLFVGTFTPTNGAAKPVKIQKVSNDELQTKIDAVKATMGGVIVAPGPDVPKDCAAFSGRWAGNWPGYGRTWLWVAQVSAICIAKCTQPDTADIPNKNRFQFCDITDKVLVLKGSAATLSYELHGDELWARYVSSSGQQNNTVFRKLKPGEN